MISYHNKNIIIFGAGIAGQAILKLLQQSNEHVEAFYDNGACVPYHVQGIPVLRINLKNFDLQNHIFIIAIHNMDEAVEQLESAGIYEWIPAYELLNGATKQRLSFLEIQKIEAIYFYYEHYYKKQGLCLNSVDFVITERCSLRCGECSNLMQYYISPKDFVLDELKYELDMLCDTVDEIYELRVIGGEPFMNKYFTDILYYIATKKNIMRISIYSNATIMPTENQLSAMKATGAWLSLSDYGNLSRNLQNMIFELKKQGIAYEYKEIGYWTKCSDFIKHGRNITQQKELFDTCCARNLITLIKGRIYTCPFIANAINLHAIPDLKGDYVDLLTKDSKEIKRQQVTEFLNQEYFNSCDWCNGRPTPESVLDKDKILPHEQIKQAKQYKQY